LTIGPKKFNKKLSYARDLALIDLPYHFGIHPSFRSMVASAILRQYHTLGFMSSSFCYNLWIANLPSFGTDSVASKGVSYFKTLHQSTARRLLSLSSSTIWQIELQMHQLSRQLKAATPEE
jgi:hypothetical protein